MTDFMGSSGVHTGPYSAHGLAMNDHPTPKSQSADPEQALAFIWKHVDRIGDCMMVTQAASGIRARPMRGLARRQDNAIWFFTSKSAPKDDEILRHPQVCVCYADPGANTYVSLSGTIELLDNQEKIDELWNPGAQAYFPAGPGDPDVLLLKFSPEAGEYWDAPSNPVVIAVQFIKAQVTGEKTRLGESAKVMMGEHSDGHAKASLSFLDHRL